ncbi:hypothetical protein [Caenispirillum salinarum]|uniref:hypothetical protein n=1 Tax=Caenispirillum salinarum TaxID=859058 RepID=UPI00384BD896
MTGTVHDIRTGRETGPEAFVGGTMMRSPASVATPVSACRAREAACLALLGLAAGPGGATVAEATAVLAHVAAGEWRAPEGLLERSAEALVEADLVEAAPEGRLFVTRAGRDALDCLLTAPEPAPVDPVTRVVLSLRLCLLDRLPPEDRAARADALAAAYGTVLDRRRAEAERFCGGLPLLGLWSRERARRLEAERDLCARVRDLFTLSGPLEGAAASG